MSRNALPVEKHLNPIEVSPLGVDEVVLNSHHAAATRQIFCTEWRTDQGHRCRNPAAFLAASTIRRSPLSAEN